MSDQQQTLSTQVPYLERDVYPLETKFPFLTPDTPSNRMQNASLACTRISVLGAFKANRLQGSYTSKDAISEIQGLSHVRSITNSSEKPAAKTEADGTTTPDQYLTHLLENYITQQILLQHLTTYDLISLRCTSRSLRRTMDLDRSLWKNVNLSVSKPIYRPGGENHYTPRGGSESMQKIVSISALRPLYKVVFNHLPGSPISPYHHVRVMILDNYTTTLSSGYGNMSSHMLELIFNNECLRRNLKMLSVRGSQLLTISYVRTFLRDWEMKIRGELRLNGWKYVDGHGDDFHVVDKQGKAISHAAYKKLTGIALEVFRFAGPHILSMPRSTYGNQREVIREIPVPVPGFLSIPSHVAKMEDGTQYYDAHSEVFVSLPVNPDTFHNGGAVRATRKSAHRLGITMDVGFCKNQDAHFRMARAGKLRRQGDPAANAWYWSICERRWENCAMKGCRWKGWTESCISCRWEEGLACRKCFGWVCQECRDKLPKGKDAEEMANSVWCGGAPNKCCEFKEGSS